jgi:hypothetical protein
MYLIFIIVFRDILYIVNVDMLINIEIMLSSNQYFINWLTVYKYNKI